MLKKSIDCKAIDVDVAKRTVVVYFSKFGNIDLVSDMIMPGSYTKTILEQGRKGQDLIWHLADHYSALQYCLSKPELEEDSFGLKGTSTILDTNMGNDVLKLYDAGFINQHSVGYRATKESTKTQDTRTYNEITEILLYEGSTVLWGANPDTPTLEVKTLAELKEMDRLLEKQLKTGTVTDEMFVLLQKNYDAIGAILKLKQADPEIEQKNDEPVGIEKGFFTNLLSLTN